MTRAVHIVTIARHTVREAWHARLFVWAAVAALLVAAAGLFVVEVAITDVDRMKAGLLGAPLRLMAVFACAALVASSVVRELHDKVIELMLSMAVSRYELFLGKLLGLTVCALIMAGIFALPLMPFTGTEPSEWLGWLQWTASLSLEVALVSAVTLLTVLCFGHMALALGATAAFYAMARLLADVQLMAQASSRSGVVDGTGAWADHLLSGLGLLLPRLDEFTRSAWLVDGAAIGAMGPLLAQTALYLVVLAAIGLWDLYRREW